MSKYLGPNARAKKKLEVETRKAGGIKARTATHEARMAVYRAIRELWICAHPHCECCELIHGLKGKPYHKRWTDHVHHVFGRDGILLFDIRKWKAACADCHRWIDANRAEAQKLGLLAKTGDWNKLSA